MKLTINDISFSYNGIPALQDINLEILPGELVAILGPNGSGKSTLLRCIDRILTPQKGIIQINEKNIQKMSRREIAKKIGYVPQLEKTPFPSTVYDTILLGRKPHIDWRPRKEDNEIVTNIMSTLDLVDLTLRKINELSGGQRQKVFIGRALAQKASILLLDEPTANLDLKHQLEVLELLKEQAEEGVSIIIAIHDINLAMKYCNKIILLKEGLIHAAGGREIITENELEEVYDIKIKIIQYNQRRIIIPEKKEGKSNGEN
jgi:iron complex transport system ATP-binding protein